MRNQSGFLCGVVLCAVLAGCMSMPPEPEPAGQKAAYVNPDDQAPLSTDMETKDIRAMTDRMMRDMLATPALLNRQTAPRVIVDGRYFKNQGASDVDKNLIVNRLRVELNRAAAGKLVFLSEEADEMVTEARDKKRQGEVDAGTVPTTEAAFAADFRLRGEMLTHDELNPNSGLRRRYHQITFEMINLETRHIAWNGIYEFVKQAQDDPAYN